MTPSVTDATATVTVNGTTVASGSASGAISLSVGSNTITTVVTAQDGVTTSTYTVSVTRAPGNTFTAWLDGYPGLSDTTPTGNPSGDGISNLVKYALGLDPTVSCQPPGTLSGNTLTFSKGTMAKADSKLLFSIEESTDLITWTAPTGTPPSGTAVDGADTISYTFTSGQTQVFVRLKVIQAQ